MDNGRLDEWYGRHVAVRFVSEGLGENQQTQATCTLESADERGVVFSFHVEDDFNHLTRRYRFIPWHKIEFIDFVPK